jgi:site-specific DNA-methyltransferase (adenine-specific)
MGTVLPNWTTKRQTVGASKLISLSSTANLLHGDVTEMMREHISEGAIDLAIADVPYFIRGPTEATDAYIHRNGMKTPFNEEWDRFGSIEQYETFCTAWIDETLRCLNEQGSLFVFGAYHNAGLINRICQMKGYVIINEIIWLQRNSRPNVATRRLQASHQNILWIVKDSKRYRFNYRLCKHNAYDMASQQAEIASLQMLLECVLISVQTLRSLSS